MDQPEMIGNAGVVLVVLASGIVSHFRGRLLTRRTERVRDEEREATTAEFTQLKAGIAEVRAFIVGPDGENGMRGELREFKKETLRRLDGLETRERDRLSEDRLHGRFGRGHA